MKNILATLKLVQSLCPPRSWLGWLVFVIFPPDSLENSFPRYWKQSQANLLADQVLAAELQARTETKTLIYSDWRNMIVTGGLPHIFCCCWDMVFNQGHIKEVWLLHYVTYYCVKQKEFGSFWLDVHFSGWWGPPWSSHCTCPPWPTSSRCLLCAWKGLAWKNSILYDILISKMFWFWLCYLA